MCPDWFVSLHASSSKQREIASETQSRGGSLDHQDNLCKHAHKIDFLHEEYNKGRTSPEFPPAVFPATGDHVLKPGTSQANRTHYRWLWFQPSVASKELSRRVI
jgi:hypothetical protein